MSAVIKFHGTINQTLCFKSVVRIRFDVSGNQFSLQENYLKYLDIAPYYYTRVSIYENNKLHRREYASAVHHIITIMDSPMVGHLCDTDIKALNDKQSYIHPS